MKPGVVHRLVDLFLGQRVVFQACYEPTEVLMPLAPIFQPDRVGHPGIDPGVKLGGTTLRSVGHVKRIQRILDNDAEYVTPLDMIAELRDDNAQLSRSMREAHSLCDEAGDVEAPVIAWYAFDKIFPHLFTLALNLLYPGAGYGYG